MKFRGYLIPLPTNLPKFSTPKFPPWVTRKWAARNALWDSPENLEIDVTNGPEAIVLDFASEGVVIQVLILLAWKTIRKIQHIHFLLGQQGVLGKTWPSGYGCFQKSWVFPKSSILIGFSLIFTIGFSFYFWKHLYIFLSLWHLKRSSTSPIGTSMGASVVSSTVVGKAS